MLLASVSALQATPAAEDAFARRAWARVERVGSFHAGSTRIDMATDGWDAANKRFEHEFRLIGRDRDDVVVTLWASSRTCPAVREVASLADLPPPEFQPPGDGIEVVADGVWYSVTVPAGYGGQSGEPLKLTSNIGTPLAAWVDGALARLERCWTPVEPRVP